jgi:Zn-dependent protease
VNAFLVDAVTLLPMFWLSLVLHEYAHAFVAVQLGDDTPRAMGKLSLDPRAHLDPLGSLVMPLVGLSSGFVFGWAKPVQTVPRHFRRGLRDLALVALAGPAMNLVLTGVFALLLRTLSPMLESLPEAAWLAATSMLRAGITVNVLLCVFNLVPLPPLDGSKVLAALLPGRLGTQLLSLPPVAAFIALVFVVRTGVLHGPMGVLQSVALAIAG